MKIVINEEELQHHIIEIFKILPGNTVLLDHFLDQTKEAEIDAICDGNEVLILGVMEHIEPAGIHSGDSYAVLPPYSLSQEIIAQMEDYTRQIALAMNVKGLINLQFAIRGSQVYVIEANPRASRTAPFICKAYGQPYIQWATQIMLGAKTLQDFQYEPRPNGYAIKIPVFSYDKFPDIQKELGPEMKSTGEAIRFIHSLQDPYFLQLLNERNLYLSR